MYKTEIRSNGSKWAGQEPDSLEVLYSVLKEYSLDPDFERYGNFFQYVTEPHFNIYHFHGNFSALSHVFDIITDDPEVIDNLLGLIFDNQGNAVYQAIKLNQINKRKLYFDTIEEMKRTLEYFGKKKCTWDKWKKWIEVSVTDDELADYLMYMDDIAFKKEL